MKTLLIIWLLLMLSVQIGFTQKIVQRINDRIIVESNMYLGAENDTLVIRGLRSNNLVQLGFARILNIKEHQTIARIIKENRPYQIKKGDFAKNPESDNYVNQVDSTVVNELLQHKKTSANSETDSKDSFELRLAKTKQKTPNPQLPNFRINLEYGYGYRYAEISEESPDIFKSYYDGLRTGMNINADVAYFPWRSYGLGVRYTFFKNSNQMDNVTITDENGNVLGPGPIEDNISYFTIGPAVLHRAFLSNNKVAVISGFTIGYLGYKDNSEYLGVPILIEGNNLGVGAWVSADFFVSTNIAIGLSLSWAAGTMDKVDVNGENVDLPEKENLNRFDAGGGLKFYF